MNETDEEIDTSILRVDESIRNLIKEFSEKQGLKFEFFVGNNMLDVASFGCVFYFNVSDIYYDIKTNQPKGRIIEWLHDAIENHENKKHINYESFCMGLRYNNLTESNQL